MRYTTICTVNYTSWFCVAAIVIGKLIVFFCCRIDMIEIFQHAFKSNRVTSGFENVLNLIDLQEDISSILACLIVEERINKTFLYLFKSLCYKQAIPMLIVRFFLLFLE